MTISFISSPRGIFYFLQQGEIPVDVDVGSYDICSGFSENDGFLHAIDVAQHGSADFQIREALSDLTDIQGIRNRDRFNSVILRAPASGSPWSTSGLPANTNRSLRRWS